MTPQMNVLISPEVAALAARTTPEAARDVLTVFHPEMRIPHDEDDWHPVFDLDTFTGRLLQAWRVADPAHHLALSRTFPALGAAIQILFRPPDDWDGTGVLARVASGEQIPEVESERVLWPEVW